MRSYLYASDLVVWLLTILLKGEINVPYNVGSDLAISIVDLAILVNSFQSNKKEVKIIGLNNNKPREQYVPDISRSIKSLNLQLTVSVEESIRRTIQFHQNTVQ
jgi:dTDP-glucose 4,6-dehydratase